METSILSIDDGQARGEVLRRLSAGDLVALPTETVYGLAADATAGTAVARIFEAKGRPSFNPLIAHVADMAMARRIARFGPVAEALAARFWPGPMTLVLPVAPDSPIHPLALAGLATIAVRIPRGPMREIVAAFGRPLAAPSANRSGRVSPTTAAHVAASLRGRIPLVLDGGACGFGLESTILKPADGRIALLRPGALTGEEVEAALGVTLDRPGEGLEAPGQMVSHYAPSGRVRLNAAAAEAGEHLMAFGPVTGEAAARAMSVVHLSEASDLREAAANLFAVLNQLDSPQIERIAVMPIPETGLGIAINDRLRRAAAPR